MNRVIVAIYWSAIKLRDDLIYKLLSSFKLEENLKYYQTKNLKILALELNLMGA